MEVLVEISAEDAEKLNIKSRKLSFEELRRKIALSELGEALKKTQEAAKMYGLDKLSMEDINSVIAEAKSNYNDKSGERY